MNTKLEALKAFDTPTIANVVATYPGKDYCLGLYHPWYGHWYTDQTLKCMYPELGRTVGHVVTCTYGMPDPDGNSLKFADLLHVIAGIEGPVIVAVKQDFPEDIVKINGLLGGNMMTAFKTAGVVGVLSDGPSRDVDEIRHLAMQYMITGTTAGHGKFSLRAINTPVEVCGMQVSPNDMIHMDENGAVKFPASYLDEVLEKASYLAKIESLRQARMLETKDMECVIKIMNGVYDKELVEIKEAA